MGLPLEGLRVLDLSRVLSGPFCTMNLGDLGAEVIKIEETKKGDDTRAFGPPFVHGESTYFLSINRNKKSVAVDLKAPQGCALIRRLAATCDVVVENFRPGVAARLGLDAAALRTAHPRLIYCSISGFGHEGDPAFTALPGYDAIVQGLSGLQHVTGHPDGPPTRIGVPISDLLSGMAAFQAILAALYTRERTGEGAFLDVSMLDATAQVLTFHASSALNAGTTPRRLGNRHASIAPYETFSGSDGVYFNVAVGNDAQFVELCRMLGTPQWVTDPLFATNPARVKNRDQLSPGLQALFSTRPALDWVEQLGAAGIPAGTIATVNEVVAHPQLAARGKLLSFTHPTAGVLKAIGSPLPQASKTATAPPRLGEHTHEVLSRILGLAPQEIDELVGKGVLRSTP
ncbi:MAG: Formyl-CoA transferase [Myxococcaceae bacterium]|nr:Formyl-CoA transferase [Myxococcaceae bacterium]